jgi:hypothetical protein
VNHLVFDVESIAIDKASDYLEPAVAPSNYVKQEAIDAYIAKANAEALAKAALDVDLARIVAIGICDDYIESSATVCIAKNESEEKAILTAFWLRVIGGNGSSTSTRPVLIGFNCLAFDLPLLLRRSLYLGVKAPYVQVGKYRHDGVVDLMMSLSFDGALRYRGLRFYAKRFALDVANDPNNGADIAALVAAGDWAGVSAHCRSDVALTVALARRVGVM